LAVIFVIIEIQPTNPIMNRLAGQVAIITGGAKGIGEGVCRVFCQEGATVISWDVADGQASAETISAGGGKISFRRTDITDRADVQKGVEEAIAAYGKVDILINNAGIIRDRSLMKMSDEEWDSVIEVNLTGTFNVTKAVLPHMKQAGYGRIVSASSINGILGAFGQTNYAATKAAIIGFTKSLAKEVGKYGITVNAVAPGFIATDMTAGMPKNVIDAAIASIPVRRVGTPEDMAHAYLFLASKEAGFVNGHTLSANGGSF
jgi:3-oxoacyl-[acyl-carrier protein] reductase